MVKMIKEIVLAVNALILVSLLFLVRYARVYGSLIGAVTLFAQVLSIYIAGEAEFDTELGFIFCRHINGLFPALSIVLGVNCFLSLLFIVYNRLGSLPLPMVALSGCILGLSAALAFTMNTEEEVPHHVVTTLICTSWPLFLFLIYRSIETVKVALYLLAAVGWLFSAQYRGYKEKKGEHDMVADAMFALFSGLLVLAPILVIASKWREKPTSMQAAFESHRSWILLLLALALLWIVVVIPRLD